MIISRQHLNAHFNNPQYNESVFIIVKRQPKAGRVVTRKAKSNIWQHAGTFTQKQIDDGMIAYEHIRTPISLNEFDDFIFDVESPPLKILKNVIFNISIAIENTEQMKSILGFEPLLVSEGGSSSITLANMNFSALDEYFSQKIIDNWTPFVTVHISTLPINGKLSLSGRSLYMGSSIDSRDIKSGNLLYTHDHSDTLSDRVGIKIHIRSPGDNRPLLIFHDYLNVSISPINDKLFSLEKSSMEVVRFQTKKVTNNDLYTSDMDTPPDKIRYQIMSGPTNGKIIISNNTTSGLMFSQRDIELGHVTYTHDGSNSSTKLYFQVSDGGHTPKYESFNIKVLPLKLDLINHTLISLTQTTSVSRITNFNLAAVSNEEQSIVHYNISSKPKYGNVYIDGRVILTFTQRDVDEGKVIYLQSEMSAGSDSFYVIAWVHDIFLPEIEIKIRVEPLIKMHSLQAVAGSKVPITLYNLNTTELVQLTSSQPLFRIIRQPRLSIVKKKSKEGNEDLNSVEVNEFYYSDLVANRIFLSVKKMKVDPDHHLTDAIHFILMVVGTDVQPAKGILTIAIHPSDSNILNSLDNPRQLRPGLQPGTFERTLPSDSSSLLPIIISVILSLIITIIIISIVVVYCSKYKRRRQDKDRNEFDVISLPPPVPSESRPESFMTDYMSEFVTFTDTNSPNTLVDERHLDCQTSQSEASLPSDITRELSSRDLTARELSPSLPQCKVTPIFAEPSLISPCKSPSHVSQIYQTTNQSEMAEDWNPYEQTKSVSSPMLRKNQYWV